MLLEKNPHNLANKKALNYMQIFFFFAFRMLHRANKTCHHLHNYLSSKENVSLFLFPRSISSNNKTTSISTSIESELLFFKSTEAGKKSAESETQTNKSERKKFDWWTRKKRQQFLKIKSVKFRYGNFLYLSFQSKDIA